MNRQAANRAILEYISREIEAYPGLRFSQILRNIEVVKEIRDPVSGMPVAWADEFNMEPWLVLDRILDNIKHGK